MGVFNFLEEECMKVTNLLYKENAGQWLRDYIRWARKRFDFGLKFVGKFRREFSSEATN